VSVLGAAAGTLSRGLDVATLSGEPDGTGRTSAATRGEGSDPTGTAAAPAAPLAFEQVYETHLDFVWRSLRLLGVDPESVEDATQDVFSIVSRQLAQFEGRSSLRTWLFAILQRVASNQRRTSRRKLRPLQPFAKEAIGLAPTPHAHAEAAEAMDIVQGFCETLDLDRRAVFVLSLLEELPATEVSLALGIPVNTVYSRVRSLREGLRRRLAEREVEHG
jgi:RNA polymerase sigma-70 factor, ECF subfamily